MNEKVKKIVLLAMFLAICVVLNIVETIIITPIPLLGIRLGISNIITLIVLYYYTIKDFLLVGFLKVIIVALLFSSFGVSFYLSFIGWLFSSLFSSLLYLFFKPSIYGLSIISSITHCVFQTLFITIIYQNIYMLNYLPVLLITSLVTGFLIAFISKRIILLLNKIYKVEEVSL